MPYALAGPEYKSSLVLGMIPLLLHSCIVDQITHAHVPVWHAEMDASLTKSIGWRCRIACFSCPMGAWWRMWCHKGLAHLCGGVWRCWARVGVGGSGTGGGIIRLGMGSASHMWPGCSVGVAGWLFLGCWGWVMGCAGYLIS